MVRTNDVSAAWSTPPPPLSTGGAAAGAMKGLTYRQTLNLQQPANLPMPLGRAYFGEEMATLRRRNAKLRALAVGEQQKAMAAEARVAELEAELAAAVGSAKAEHELLSDVELERRVQVRAPTTVPRAARRTYTPPPCVRRAHQPRTYRLS